MPLTVAAQEKETRVAGVETRVVARTTSLVYLELGNFMSELNNIFNSISWVKQPPPITYNRPARRYLAVHLLIIKSEN